jgi:type IV secretory pathway VirJ component
MNPIGLALDAFVAALLIAALVMGARLNARLKALREGQANFVKAIGDLDQAATRAETGLADLRAASESVHDQLLTRIETARALVLKLERLSQDADRTLAAAPAVSPGSASPNSPSSRAMAAMAALSQRAAAPRAAPEPRPARAPEPLRPTPARRPTVDDDLFEPDAGLGPLRRKDDRR